MALVSSPKKWLWLTAISIVAYLGGEKRSYIGSAVGDFPGTRLLSRLQRCLRTQSQLQKLRKRAVSSVRVVRSRLEAKWLTLRADTTEQESRLEVNTLELEPQREVKRLEGS